MTKNKTVTELDETLNSEIIVDKDLLSDEETELAPAPLYVKHSIFKPSFHQRKKVINTGENILFENPLEARSPQEVLEAYGIRRRDTSMFPNNSNLPSYGDFSEFIDLGDRVNVYLSCKEQFEALPSEVRKDFNNSLDEFTKYINSNDFDVTRLMSKEYKEKVYEPKLRKDKRDKAYAEYLKQKQDEEMNAVKPPQS